MLSVFQRMMGLHEAGCDPTDLICGFMRGVAMWIYEASLPGEKLANLEKMADEVNKIIAGTKEKIASGELKE